MHRGSNLRDAFPRSADEYAQPVMRLLQQRRADMDASWEKLEKEWTSHSRRMGVYGLSPRTRDEGAVKLNVGGSNVTVSWQLLAEAEGFKDSVLFPLLEGVWDKDQIPHDADGRIVLDESPACIQHIIHTMLRDSSSGRASKRAKTGSETAQRSAVAVDEVPCLIYTSHVMGLLGSVPAHPEYVKMDEASTILEPFEIAPFSAKVRQWIGGSAEQMTLVYRATRDLFYRDSLTNSLDEGSPKTISLIRVRSGEGKDDDDIIVGSYSVIPVSVDDDSGSESGESSESSESSGEGTPGDPFVFMLKDGRVSHNDLDEPTKWHRRSLYSVDDSVRVANPTGVCFGGYDLAITFDDTYESGTLQTGRKIFDIEGDSPFLELNGKKVVDIEVYRYSIPAPPTVTAPSATGPDEDALADAEAHDIDSFGKSIASSLMEERVVLDRAVKEMEAAGERVSAALDARRTVYGPRVADDEDDAVVDLNVRGTRMTTLRSTLQACPRSALAPMFNDDRWPATDRDMDGHGRRLIDCSPTCFSKILDVLRMRKRASWSRSAAEGGEESEEEEEEKGGGGGGGGGDGVRVLSGGVHIKAADYDAFEEAVDMYFPGCESFIMDLVEQI